mgnify:CR=1 FL=1
MPTDDHIVLNPGTGGATLATDYISSSNIHYQLVQPVYGAENSSKTLITKTAAGALPTTILMPANFHVPVAGSTNGANPVTVSITGGVTLSVGNITVVGGTLSRISDGVTADIRSTNGVTFSVVGQDGADSALRVEATFGQVHVGGTVGINTIVIPGGGGITSGQTSVGTTPMVLPGRIFETGFKVKNYGTNTIFVGGTMSTSMTLNGYPLAQYDELFIEATGSNGIYCTTMSGSSDVRIIGT